MSIKNNWKDNKGYIYLIFSIKELSDLLEIDRKAVMRYKKLLTDYGLIIDKRLGQGRPNRIYVLKPDLRDNQKSQKGSLEVPNKDTNDTYLNATNLNNVNRTSGGEAVENSREGIKEKKIEKKEDINGIRKKIRESLREKENYNFLEPIDSEIENNILENDTDPEGKYSKSYEVGNYHNPKRYRSTEKEQLAKEIAEELDDEHSLGAFRTIVDRIPEQQIRIFFSIIKDTHLTGKIKKNKGAMFMSLARAYAKKNNIELNFK